MGVIPRSRPSFCSPVTPPLGRDEPAGPSRRLMQQNLVHRAVSRDSRRPTGSREPQGESPKHDGPPAERPLRDQQLSTVFPFEQPAVLFSHWAGVAGLVFPRVVPRGKVTW